MAKKRIWRRGSTYVDPRTGKQVVRGDHEATVDVADGAPPGVDLAEIRRLAAAGDPTAAPTDIDGTTPQRIEYTGEPDGLAWSVYDADGLDDDVARAATFDDAVELAARRSRSGSITADGRWINPGGSLGGHVASTASVEPGCYVDPDARVLDHAMLQNGAHIGPGGVVAGNSLVSGPRSVISGLVTDRAEVVNTPVGHGAAVRGDATVQFSSVSGEGTLIHGGAWVMDSEVAGGARVEGDAVVGHKSTVHGPAVISGGSLENVTATGKVAVGPGTKIRDSELGGEAAVHNSEVVNTKVFDQGRIAGSDVRDATVTGEVRNGTVDGGRVFGVVDGGETRSATVEERVTVHGRVDGAVVAAAPIGTDGNPGRVTVSSGVTVQGGHVIASGEIREDLISYRGLFPRPHPEMSPGEHHSPFGVPNPPVTGARWYPDPT